MWFCSVLIQAYHIPEHMRTSAPRIPIFEVTFHTAQLAASRPHPSSVLKMRSLSKVSTSFGRKKPSQPQQRSLTTVFPTRSKTMTQSLTFDRPPPPPPGPQTRPMSASASSLTASVGRRTTDGKRKSRRTQSRVFLRTTSSNLKYLRHGQTREFPGGSGSGSGSLKLARASHTKDVFSAHGIDLETELGQPFVASSLDRRLLQTSVLNLRNFSVRSEDLNHVESVSSIANVDIPNELSRQASLGSCSWCVCVVFFTLFVVFVYKRHTNNVTRYMGVGASHSKICVTVA